MAIEIPGPAPADTAPAAESWGHYLDLDETLLWQGAPGTGVRFGGADIAVGLFGCVFLAFALFWTFMVATLSSGTEMGGFFPLFGLLFVAVGAFLVFGRPFWNAHVRRHTRYALTDRRAIVARSAWGRSLKSYPIDEDTQIDYRPGREATIYFAQEERRGNKGRRYTVRHGFEFIPDGDEVYRVMRQIQQRDRDGRDKGRRDG